MRKKLPYFVVGFLILFLSITFILNSCGANPADKEPEPAKATADVLFINNDDAIVQVALPTQSVGSESQSTDTPTEVPQGQDLGNNGPLLYPGQVMPLQIWHIQYLGNGKALLYDETKSTSVDLEPDYAYKDGPWIYQYTPNRCDCIEILGPLGE